MAPVAELAAELDLPLLKTSDVNSDESRAQLAATGAEVGMVCAFGQIIREPLLSDLTMLNVHPSLLPRWRGAAPIERAIMAGDAETGVCIIELESGLDSGPILLSRRTAIGPDENYGELAVRLATIGGELAADAIGSALEGSLNPVPQPGEGVTYAEKIDKRDRQLDPTLSAEELVRMVRALDPHIGAHLSFDDGERLGIVEASALSSLPDLALEEGDVSGDLGELVAIGDQLILTCRLGWLRLDLVKPPGSRPMGSGDYLRGHRPPRHAISPGAR